MKKQFIQIVGSTILGIFLLGGCGQPSAPSDVDAKRKSIDEMASTTITKLELKHKGLEKEIENSLGYLVVNWKTVKVPIVGAGNANGVVVDLKSKERTYVKISRFDLGVGWGVRHFKSLVVIDDPKVMAKVEKGTWIFDGGGEGTAGKATADVSASAIDGKKKGYKAYMLMDGGASITASLRAMHLKKDKKLN